MNIQKLIEKVLVESSKDFDISTTEHLLYLVHDKSHVIDNKSKVGFLNTVFAAYRSEKSKLKIYRGLYKEKLEDFKVGEDYILNRYQSFSEDPQIAHSFSKNKLVLQLNSHNGGFPYWKWLTDFYKEMKRKDPHEYNSVDGDFMIETAAEEKEWIFNIGTTIKIIDTVSKSGYTHIIAEM